MYLCMHTQVCMCICTHTCMSVCVCVCVCVHPQSGLEFAYFIGHQTTSISRAKEFLNLNPPKIRPHAPFLEDDLQNVLFRRGVKLNDCETSQTLSSELDSSMHPQFHPRTLSFTTHNLFRRRKDYFSTTKIIHSCLGC